MKEVLFSPYKCCFMSGSTKIHEKLDIKTTCFTNRNITDQVRVYDIVKIPLVDILKDDFSRYFSNILFDECWNKL